MFAGPSELLINVRGAEILTGLHKDYMPLNLNYYEQLVDLTGFSPVFMGQVDDNPYGNALKKSFPKARFLNSRSPIADFSIILNSVHVACSVSSFSWLAAWMSFRAETIHLPLAGFLNPIQRPDIDLLPLSDGRFRYYDFPIMHWEGSQSQMEMIVAGKHDFSPINLDEVKAKMRKKYSRA
jgi:hypothetical protein